MRGARGAASAGTRRGTGLVDKFAAEHLDAGGGLNADSHSSAFDVEDGHGDVATDKNSLVRFSSQDEHGTLLWIALACPLARQVSHDANTVPRRRKKRPHEASVDATATY